MVDEQLTRWATEKVEQERAEAREHLAELQARDVAVVKAAAKASERYHKLADKHPDMTYTVRDGGTRKHTQLGVAWRALQQAIGAVEAMGRSLQKARRRCEILDSPEAIDKAVRDAERQQRGRPPKGESSSNGRSSMAAPKVTDADRKALIDKVKKYVKDNGGDETKAAAALNKDKVPTLRGVVGNWDKRRVAWMAAGALPPSQQGTSTPRAKKPAARKPAARQKPAARAAARTGSATNGKTEATPLDKGKQASGTSRGGSGRRGATAAKK